MKLPLEIVKKLEVYKSYTKDLENNKKNKPINCKILQ